MPRAGKCGGGLAVEEDEENEGAAAAQSARDKSRSPKGTKKDRK